ncbi:MAG: TRAP transporter substrate-binding protein [Kiritimatiellae bacterium]|nr:TRAP transporter substrate-binding protein [Kiritimatiellia bacterium]HHU14701.1 TRAP transporter substrate-binding protein [Lentisphaerota bacterium]HON47542.1 TRAP transporter substrate-binding protein [Kiritimatiellia bacterium]
MTGVLIACILGAFVIRPKAGSKAGGRTIVIKLAHGLDEAHPVHQAMILMKQRLEELTDGKATIDLYSGGVLGGETDCLEQVQRGELAMTKVSTAALEAFIPEMKVFSIPFTFRDENHFWTTLNGDIGKKLLAKGAAQNFQGLCYYDSGDRNFYSTKKPIRTIDDVKGMKIRVMNSRTAMDMINAMGGSPCPITWGELYTALAQGTVDAAENNPPSFDTSRHFEVCKYFTFTAHQRIPDMVIMSTKVWNTLPQDVQVALQKAADESEVYQRKLWKEKTEQSLALAKEKGVELITPELDGFRKACAGIIQHKDYADIVPVYKAIQEVK